MEIKATLELQNNQIHLVDKNNFKYHFIGFDGKLYENYGTIDKPLYEEVFDSTYKIEYKLTNELKHINHILGKYGLLDFEGTIKTSELKDLLSNYGNYILKQN